MNQTQRLPGSMPRSSVAANRLGWCGLALLLIGCLVLCAVTYQQLHSLRQSSENTRAQLLSKSAAQRIQHAVTVGIPLTELQGMKEFFQHRLNTHADIQSMSVHLAEDMVVDIASNMADGKVLWLTQRDSKQTANDSGVQADAPIVVNGKTVANVRLQLRPTSAKLFAVGSAALLLPVVLLLSVLAWLGARVSEAQGWQLRNFTTRLALRASRNGRYERTYIVSRRKEFDLRVQALAHLGRNVHESLIRMRRLITSLRVTEPQLARREQLDQLLLEAEGQNHFAADGMIQIRVVASAAQAFWAALLTSLSAIAVPTLLSLSLPQENGAWLEPLRMSWFALGACAGALLSTRLAWRANATVFASCLLLCLSGLLLALGLVSGLGLTGLLSGLYGLCGAASGAALQACLKVQEHGRDSNSSLASSPHWPLATLGAWSLSLLWLAPALAAATHDAVGLQLGAAALSLPAACCIIHLLLWNEPRSPWRATSSPAAPRADRRSPMISSGGIAAMTIGALSVLTQALPHDAMPQYVSSALGLGVLAGLFTRLLNRPQLVAIGVLALLLSVLQLALPEQLNTGVLRVTSACLTAAGMGLCTSSLLKMGEQRRAAPSSHFLCPLTLGVLVAAAGIAAGLDNAVIAAGCLALVGAGLWLESQPTRSDRHAA